jgi:ribosomal protein S15P/S13E
MMSKHPNDEVARRLRDGRLERDIATLQKLIVDLSDHLTDEGCDWTNDGLDRMRRRVANAVHPDKCPDWLMRYRDPPTVKP